MFKTNLQGYRKEQAGLLLRHTIPNPLTAFCVRYFGSVEILTIFFSTLLGATARNAFAPAAVAFPLE
jgi:hypothetical protein